MTDEREKAYVSLDDAAKAVGMKKSSLYYYLKALAIETHKFPLNKHAYIATRDLKRIQDVKHSPWKLSENEGQNVLTDEEDEAKPKGSK
jgi:hypothetical protein